MSIHNSAIIHKNATIEDNVTIGPYSVIGENVHLEYGVELKSHVVVEGYTTIGKNSIIFPFASIGHIPQDLKYSGEKSKIIIGKNNIIREYVTIQPGTQIDKMKTKIGDNCCFMAGSHVAHDCIVGNNAIFANNATLGGHVIVGDYVTIGGLAAVHQNVRIGDNAIIGGISAVVRDVIPFGMVSGERASLIGVNIIGMQRRGFSQDEIIATQESVKLLFNNNDTLISTIAEIKEKFSNITSINKILQFMSEETIRSYCKPKDE